MSRDALTENPDDYCFFDVETRSPEDVTLVGAYRHNTAGLVVIFTYAIGETGEIKDWVVPDFETRLNWHDMPQDLHDFWHRARRGEAWFVAWNAAFDRLAANRGMDAYGNTGVREVLTVEMTIDAMAQAVRSHLPPDLLGAGASIGAHVQKDKDGKRLIKLFSDPEGGGTPQSHPEDWEKFRQYARDDVGTMREIFFGTLPLSRAEWEEYWASERINDRGLPIDTDFVRAASDLAEYNAQRVNADVTRISDNELYSVNQHVKMTQWVMDRLGHLSRVKKILTKEIIEGEPDEDGNDTHEVKLSLGRSRVEELILFLEKRDEEIGLTDDEADALDMLDVRVFGASATPRKFTKMLRQVEDGRLRGSYVFNGAAATGRFSSRGVQCVTGEHEVLTRQGWVPIQNAVGPVEIMAWDSVANRLRWEEGTVSAFGPAPVAAVDSTVVKGVFTWDHRVPQRPWKRLRDTCPKDIIDGRQAKNCVVSAPVDQPEAPYSDAQLRLLVAMQSDGSWARGAARWRFAKRRKMERLCKLLEEENVPFKVTREEKQGTWYVRIPKKNTPVWLIKDFSARLLSLSARQASLVLDEYTLWDGWAHTKNRTLCVSSPRKDQMEWLATVAALAGRTSTLTEYSDKKGYASWRFYLRSSQTTNIRENQVHDAGMQDVFCPTVPSGYWLCRYGDRIYVTGNTHNLTRSTVAKTPDEEAEVIDTIIDLDTEDVYDKLTKAHGPVGRTLSRLIRPSITAPEGYELVWGDWSAIEARVLPWLAKSEKAERVLDTFRTNDANPELPDIYKVTASDILKVIGQPVDAADISGYQRQGYGKVPTLSLGFGGAEGALFAMATAYGIVFSDEEARTIVEAWREANPWARRFWDTLWYTALEAMDRPMTPLQAGRVEFLYVPEYLQGTLFMFLPCGRPLLYPRIRWERREIKDKNTGKVSKREQLTYRRGYERAALWYGTLAENATQGFAGSLMRRLLRELEDMAQESRPPLFLPVGHTHDEALGMAEIDAVPEAREFLQERMLHVPGYAEGLPLAAGVDSHYCYTKTLD